MNAWRLSSLSSAIFSRESTPAANAAMVRAGRGVLRLARRSQATCSCDGGRGPAAHHPDVGPPRAARIAQRSSTPRIAIGGRYKTIGAARIPDDRRTNIGDLEKFTTSHWVLYTLRYRRGDMNIADDRRGGAVSESLPQESQGDFMAKEGAGK